MNQEQLAERNLVSLVVPVYNEHECIPLFYKEACSVMDGAKDYKWELVFVDDGSRDSSACIIQDICKKDGRVRLVRLSRNFGSHAALTAGMSCASGDAVAVMSVDLQDPPALVKQFADMWKDGNHIVWGVRKSRKDAFRKSLLTNMFYWLTRKLAFPDYPEGGMDCGLFDRKVVGEFLKISDRNGFIFATIFWLGFKQAFIPYDREQRPAGESKWPFWKRVKAAFDMVVCFSYTPIRFISVFGFGVSVLGLIYAAFLAFRRLAYGYGGAGWAEIMVVMLFLGGVQMMMLGVLGEYIWRTSNQAQGRPLYIISEQNGFPVSES